MANKQQVSWTFAVVFCFGSFLGGWLLLGLVIESVHIYDYVRCMIDGCH